MFKERLRYLREYQELSQADVAKRLNVTQTTYSRYESGAHLPRIEILKKMSALFNVSIDYLLENNCDIAEISDVVDINDFIANGKYTIDSKFPTEKERQILNNVINAIFNK